MQTTNTQPTAAEVSTKKERYDRKLITSAVCLAMVFFLSLQPYATPQHIIWHEVKSWSLIAAPVVLSSFALIHLLPVLVRCRGQQWLKAAVLAVLAGYFAFRYWEMVVENYVING